tara:strand:- start:3594 stop:3764 length:171 start_codon:yes stop_codon:yes gene_type:complete
MFGTKAQDVENVTQTTRQPEREKVVAERLNGQLAMLGLVAASVSYATTGHMFFGLV